MSKLLLIILSVSEHISYICVPEQVNNLREIVSTIKANLNLTCLADYIKAAMHWMHWRQIKALTMFVAAIVEQQTGCQAQLARICCWRSAFRNP
jgi:hypothetical protein